MHEDCFVMDRFQAPASQVAESSLCSTKNPTSVFSDAVLAQSTSQCASTFTEIPAAAFPMRETVSNYVNSPCVKTSLAQAVLHSSHRPVPYESKVAKCSKLIFAAKNLMSRIHEQTMELKHAKR